jgi:hypothetical protein
MGVDSLRPAAEAEFTAEFAEYAEIFAEDDVFFPDLSFLSPLPSITWRNDRRT